MVIQTPMTPTLASKTPAQSLLKSRWAPRTPSKPGPLRRTRAEQLKDDQDKAERLLARLHWRAENLSNSYNRAVALFKWDIRDGVMPINRDCPFLLRGSNVADVAEWEKTKKMCESMFKLDFFEFYALLERYITLCLSVFGISVSGAAGGSLPPNINALRLVTNPELAAAASAATNGTVGAQKDSKAMSTGLHQFHANLLAALDDETCPLHSTLGDQTVRIQLGRAKDYRNRWKDADEQLEPEDGKTPVKLEELELEHMLHVILAGADEAILVVQAQEAPTGMAGNVLAVSNGSAANVQRGFEMEVDMRDAPYEAMGDAMDIDFDF